MERRGFIGTIMGAVSAVLVPIPVGKNMLADYAEPVKHTEDLNEVFAKYVGANCSGSVVGCTAYGSGSGTMPTHTGVLTACSGTVLPQNWDGYERT